MLSFFPRDVLDEILNLIESVSEGFPTYSFIPPEFRKFAFCLIYDLNITFFLLDIIEAKHHLNYQKYPYKHFESDSMSDIYVSIILTIKRYNNVCLWLVST